MRGKNRKDHRLRKKIKVKAAGQRNPTIRKITALPQQSKKMLDPRKKEMQKGGDRNTSRDRSKSNNSKRNSRGGGKSGGVLKSQI